MDQCRHLLRAVQFKKGRRDTRRGRNDPDSKTEGTYLDPAFGREPRASRDPRVMEELPLSQFWIDMVISAGAKTTVTGSL